MADVFISYKSSDKDRLETFFSALRAAGLSIWIDQQIAHGAGWPTEIKMQLEAAGCVVGCWTEKAITSSNVFVPSGDPRDLRSWMEIEHFQAGPKLVGVLFDPGRIPWQFQNSQAADLSRWTGDQSDPELLKLVRSIENKATPLFATRKIRTLEGRVDMAEQEVQIVQQQLAEKANRLAELHQKIAEMHGGGVEARALAARLSEAEQTMTILRADLAAAQEHSRGVQKTLNEHSGERASLTAELDRLAKAKSQSDLLAESLKAEVAKTSEALVNQAARERNLQLKLKDTEGVIQRLESKVQQIEKARTEVNAQLQQLQKETETYRSQVASAAALTAGLGKANQELAAAKQKLSEFQQRAAGEAERIAAAREEERLIHQRTARIDNNRAIEAGLAAARKGSWRWVLAVLTVGGLAGAVIGNVPSFDQGREAAKNDALLGAARVSCTEAPASTQARVATGPDLRLVSDKSLRETATNAREVAEKGEFNACVTTRFQRGGLVWDRQATLDTDTTSTETSALDARSDKIREDLGTNASSPPRGGSPSSAPRGLIEAGQELVVEARERSEVWAYDSPAGRYAGTVFVRKDGTGLPNGLGVLLYTNGNRFEGEWKDGQPTVKGVLWDANGALISR